MDRFNKNGLQYAVFLDSIGGNSTIGDKQDNISCRHSLRQLYYPIHVPFSVDSDADGQESQYKMLASGFGPVKALNLSSSLLNPDRSDVVSGSE